MYEKNRLFFFLDMLIENIKLPRISFSLKSKEDLRREETMGEVLRINEQIEYHKVFSSNQLQKIKGFDPIYFNEVYQEYGGIRELIYQFEEGKTYRQIADHFNMSKARIGQIKKAIDDAGGVGKLVINPHI
jgi:hypothetical protein